VVVFLFVDVAYLSLWSGVPNFRLQYNISSSDSTSVVSHTCSIEHMHMIYTVHTYVYYIMCLYTRTIHFHFFTCVCIFHFSSGYVYMCTSYHVYNYVHSLFFSNLSFSEYISLLREVMTTTSTSNATLYTLVT